MGVKLELKDIPVGPVAVKIKRTELSSSSKETIWIGKPLLIQGNQITLFDQTVNRGKTYKYTVCLLFKTGAIEESTSTLFQYNPVTTNIVDTVVTNLAIENDDVRFELVTTFIETDDNKVKQALEKQGMFSFFSDSVDRTKLQSLIAYKILRQNLTTGQEEEFGTTVSTMFSDKTFGTVQGVTPIVPGVGYKYTIITHLRQTESMLPNLVVSNPLHSYKPSKWFHPITLTEGALTTPESLKAYHANHAFSFGTIGRITTIITSLADVNPSIASANANMVNKHLVRVQWRIENPEQMSKIDHFIIVLEMMGSRTIVGKTHNISDTGQFFFLDALDHNEKGMMKYFITPVFHDFSHGREVETNTILV